MASSHQFLGLVTQPKMKSSVSKDSPSCSGQAGGRGWVTRCYAFPVKFKTFLDLLLCNTQISYSFLSSSLPTLPLVHLVLSPQQE